MNQPQMPKLEKPILVISHANCDDGLGAAWAAWKKFGDKADYWFAFYKSEPPPVKGKDVYILDFSYPRETMIAMHGEAKSLLVLDHHKTAEANLAGLPFCRFDGTKSGAMLSWEHFHSNIPNGVLLHHIQDYDLWKFECPRTSAFMKNLRSYPQTLAAFDTLNNGFEHPISGKDFYEAFVKEGEVLIRYYNIQLKQALKSTAHEVTLAGIKGKIANLTGMFASEAGNLMASETGTFGMTYFMHPQGDVKCSIRSIKDNGCDVSEIAAIYGGGGHAQASGFTLTKEQLMEILNAA